MKDRCRRVARRIAVVCLAVLPGLALAPGLAHADTFRTARASSSGGTAAIGAANAESSARRALAIQAVQAGEACTNVTSSSTLTFIAPGNVEYVFAAVASGTCAQIPPFTVYRTATSLGAGSSASAAIANGEPPARAAVTAAGVNCTNWIESVAFVFVAPNGSWYNYNVTMMALCTN
jgi:hypothetical protein